jgi:hypothetical protein
MIRAAAVVKTILWPAKALQSRRVPPPVSVNAQTNRRSAVLHVSSTGGGKWRTLGFPPERKVAGSIPAGRIERVMVQRKPLWLPARPPASRRSRLTTSAIAGSLYSTLGGVPWARIVNTSVSAASPSLRTRTATCSPTRPSSTTQNCSNVAEDARRSEAEYERKRRIELAQLARAEAANRLAEPLRAHSGRLLDKHAGW